MLIWRDIMANAAAMTAGLNELHKQAELILTEAIDETPLDTGALRRSGTVTDEFSRNTVHISFNTPYAVDQHEELSYRHRVGKAKYLEDPFNRNKAQAMEKGWTGNKGCLGEYEVRLCS